MGQTKLREFRAALAALEDPAHAAFHQAYHKSELHFVGVRTPALRALWKAHWPARPRLTRDDVLPLVDPLWDSCVYEETQTATWLLGRIVPELGPADLPLLNTLTRRCTGWAQLDFLALDVLGPLALRTGEPVYAPVMRWLEDDWLWTRRAAILIHVPPARKARLSCTFAWPSFAARLHEKEFFIRKAIGWALRECCKHYSQEVAAFVARHGPDMSGLTRREAIRGLPADLRPVAG